MNAFLRDHRTRAGWLALVLSTAWLTALGAQVVPYDIVYVRQARFGDTTSTIWPEVFHPARIDPGADLMLLHPDGSEEVLVAGGQGAVTDPFLSFDAQWCYYALLPDVRPAAVNYQRGDLPYAGSDIYRIHLATRQVQRLTHQEWTPNTAAGQWHPTDPVNPPSQYNRLGYGILNLGPCPLPGGKVAFTSNRNGFLPTKTFTNPCLQLFVMDEDGANVTWIAPMSFGSALHPTILRDGRIMFSSYESQGLRDERLWGIWAIWPDGRHWEPIVSAFHSPQAFHFMTQLGDGDLVVCDYYNLNNNGFGALYRFPVRPPAGQPAFHSAFMNDAPGIQQTVGAGYPYPLKFPFQPRGIFSVTPFTTGQDEAAPIGAGGVRVGKFTQPSAAPNNDLLVVWTPGPANNLNRPTTLPAYNSGLYLMPGGHPVASPQGLVLIKNSPLYNEAWPRAVVPYRAVHGVEEPTRRPWLPNDGTVHPALPRGTPHGLVGTSSFYKRETFPGVVKSWANTFHGLDAFNTDENEQSSNWFYQGSDAGRYTNSEIHAVRILAMEPGSHRSYGPHEGTQFYSHANERLRILGEIPLRKPGVTDPEGNPDTSFLAKIAADTPFTLQTIDRDGLVLNMAQTWHQLRPGEMRVDCGGCHAHSQQPLDFAQTAAGQPGFVPVDLTAIQTLLTKDGAGQPVVQTRPAGALNVEFLRDIRPVLTRSCVPCHNTTTAAGNLVLDQLTLVPGTQGRPALPGDYARLAADPNATWGYPPVTGNRTWRQTNASRYVRMQQSRRSLLIWKIFGRRLDGWLNSDHPTESTPGVAATLPPGADRNAADLDYTGTAMPPPGSAVPGLSADEKMNFARWVDLGCPIKVGHLESPQAGALGWFLDENRPTLAVSSPRPNLNAGPLREIRLGLADAYTGVNVASLSVKADFAVNGRAAGAELADLATAVAPGVFTIPLSPPLPRLAPSHLIASIADGQGNVTRTDVRFSIAPDALEVRGLVRPPGRVRLRFFDPQPDQTRRIRYSASLAAPRASWLEAPILSEAWTPANECTAEIALPPGITDRAFLVIERGP